MGSGHRKRSRPHPLPSPVHNIQHCSPYLLPCRISRHTPCKVQSQPLERTQRLRGKTRLGPDEAEEAPGKSGHTPEGWKLENFQPHYQRHTFTPTDVDEVWIIATTAAAQLRATPYVHLHASPPIYDWRESFNNVPGIMFYSEGLREELVLEPSRLMMERSKALSVWDATRRMMISEIQGAGNDNGRDRSSVSMHSQR